jgi:type VI secretion system protein ImpE
MSDGEDSAGALFRAGNLAAAIEAANAVVRKSPADLGGRILLAELLVFAGNIERADTILNAAADIDPTAMVAIAEFRQLLRAETARRQLHRDGRVPEFLGDPTPPLRASLAATVAWRAGDAAEAARQAAEAETLRPRVPGFAGEAAFDDFRDVDDFHAGFFEVLTTTGKYFWIPTERVASIEFHPPRRPRDLAWRRATVSVHDGPDGEVYLPALYDADRPDLADEYRLGRATDWLGEEDGGTVRGVGQRVFLVGDDAHGIMDLATLRFGA